MRKCQYCGAMLDAGEICDCKNGTRAFERATFKKRPLTSEELKEKLQRMSHKEYCEMWGRQAALWEKRRTAVLKVK